jgi:uncharacterized protein YjbJ (UPF0337 family)
LTLSTVQTTGQYNSLVGGIKEAVGDTTGYTGLAQAGREQKAAGDAEITAARAEGYGSSSDIAPLPASRVDAEAASVQGTADRLGGKVDHVMGAITGDSAREASGKAQYEKGVAQQSTSSWFLCIFNMRGAHHSQADLNK